MTFNPDRHNRHSIRLANFDYSRVGAYFVTICAWQRECLFGEIVNGAMVLNDLGRVVASEWERTAQLRSNVAVDVYTTMPNHFHAIFFINDPEILREDPVGAHRRAPRTDGAPCPDVSPVVGTSDCHIDTGPMAHVENRAIEKRAHDGAPLRRRSGSVGSIVAGFKSAATKQINAMRDNPGCPVWQRNYYERVIRNENELSRAREYIVNNPLQWALDRENPINVPSTTGNDHL